MNTSLNSIQINDTKIKLSVLWIFAMFNYLYCDIVGLMDHDLLNQFLTGHAGGMDITAGFLLGASILMEIPTAMILLSIILNSKINRWFNIIAALIMTVVQTLTLFSGTPTIYYVFFSIIEIGCTAFIAWYAWNWRVSTDETLK